MEFKVVLSHGPVVWAIELVAFSLDTGEEVERVMLNSTTNYLAAQYFVHRLAKMTGFASYIETWQDCDKGLTQLS
jgi:hypothetical protein